jgi:ribosomal protein S18 acetylase RimI-like enzyme
MENAAKAGATRDPGEEVEFIAVDPSSPESVSCFLQLGRAYLSALDSVPADVNARFLGSMVWRQQESDRWLFLMRCGGDWAGFVHAKIDRDERTGWGYILEFYVAPHLRRRGWGRRLFSHLAAILKSRGVTNVWLTSNESAAGFWDSLGFRRTGQRERGHEIMILRLPS